jgi:hypothetical protein
MIAAAADTLISPDPVARSRPGVAGLLKRGWLRPRWQCSRVPARPGLGWRCCGCRAALRPPRRSVAPPPTSREECPAVVRAGAVGRVTGRPRRAERRSGTPTGWAS